MRMVINIYNEFMPLRYLCILATRRRCAVLCTGNMYKVIDVFGCFFFNAHGYKYITLNADLSEYIIIFMSHLFGCVRMCVIFRHTDEASLLIVSARRLHRAAIHINVTRWLRW